MDGLAGNAVLITGAASGISRASAVLFAGAGAAGALVDVGVDEDGLAVTADLVRSWGAVTAIVADVADLSAVTRAVSDTVDRFGRLDAAHNNAGTDGPDARAARGRISPGRSARGPRSRRAPRRPRSTSARRLLQGPVRRGAPPLPQ